MKLPNLSQNERGFTLTELMVVVAIALSMVGFTYSGFSSWERRERVRQAAYQLASQLKVARMLSIEKHRFHFVNFGGNVFTVYRNTFEPNPNPANQLEVGDAQIFQVDESKEHKGTTMSVITAGLSTLSFDLRGLVTGLDSSNANVAPDAATGSWTVKFANSDDSTKLCVAVSSLGRISFEDQAPACP